MNCRLRIFRDPLITQYWGEIYIVCTVNFPKMFALIGLHHPDDCPARANVESQCSPDGLTLLRCCAHEGEPRAREACARREAGVAYWGSPWGWPRPAVGALASATARPGLARGLGVAWGWTEGGLVG